MSERKKPATRKSTRRAKRSVPPDIELRGHLPVYTGGEWSVERDFDPVADAREDRERIVAGLDRDRK